MIKNMRGKLGNSADARDNQGDIKENVCFCLFNQ